MIIELLFLIPGLLFLGILLYLYVLAIVALWPGRKENKLVPARMHFAVIIPAHNEVELIGKTLASLQASDYPMDLYEIIVVADNCDDNTEDVVRSAGVTCWQRFDPDNRGKGNVLKWVFPRLLDYGTHDAFVVIDADSHLQKDFLHRINHHFCQGAQVVQGYSQVRHPGNSPMESLAFLGFALNRNLRYCGRSRLGWTSNLMGTGMCFQREVILEHGWNTTSMVEDIEYEMILHLHGIRVLFAEDARLSVELHKSIDQSRDQRTRWDLGKFEVRNTYVPKLLKEGFRKKDCSYFDSALELLLPPFSLLCVLMLAGCMLYALVGYQGISSTSVVWGAVFFSLIFYILLGLVTAKAGVQVYRALLYAPFFILWRFGIIFVELFKRNKGRQW